MKGEKVLVYKIFKQVDFIHSHSYTHSAAELILWHSDTCIFLITTHRVSVAWPGSLELYTKEWGCCAMPSLQALDWDKKVISGQICHFP